MEKIEISIPNFIDKQYLKLNTALIELMEKYPEKFNNDVFIGSVYDSFCCLWNGGRASEDHFYIDKVKKIVDYFNSHNIAIRYTFTNMLVDKYNLYDDFLCNQILIATLKAQSRKNDINLYSEKLKEYIETKYPNQFNILFSTTLGIKDVDKINKITERNILVPDYSVNNDFNKIKQLKYPERVEFLADESCYDNCPARHTHYEHMSKSQLKLENEPFKCIYDNYMNYFEIKSSRKSFISLEDIRSKYQPLGFNKFKLIGRGSTVHYVIESYVDYFVKPEYKDEIRQVFYNYIFE